jgi:predicted nucleotidyltransferase
MNTTNMIQSRYLNQIKKMIRSEISPKAKVFIFGSAVKTGRFHDLDIGIEGLTDDSAVSRLREKFEDSTIPYSVDVINFSKVDKQFKQTVLKDRVIWLT